VSDTELAALTALVNTETEAMRWENECRVRNDNAVAYRDDSFTSLDCVRCLDAELRRRGVLRDTTGSK
jgi:hypothetical protein